MDACCAELRGAAQSIGCGTPLNKHSLVRQSKLLVCSSSCRSVIAWGGRAVWCAVLWCAVQVPDDIIFLEEIPHNATGKVSKLTLRQMFKDYKPAQPKL